MEVGIIFLIFYKPTLFLFQFYAQKLNSEACQVILMSILVLDLSATELLWWIGGKQTNLCCPQVWIQQCGVQPQPVQGQQCLGHVQGSWRLIVRAGKCCGKSWLARQCLLSGRTISKSSNMSFVQGVSSRGTFWFLASPEASQLRDNITNYWEREQ